MSQDYYSDVGEKKKLFLPNFIYIYILLGAYYFATFLVFSFCGCTPLAILNLIALIGHIALAFLIKTNKITDELSFFISFGLIDITSISTTLLMGWHFEYMLLPIGLIPVIYYVTYTNRKKYSIKSLIVLILVLESVFITFLLSYIIKPTYLSSLGVSAFLTFLNLTYGIGFIILFCYALNCRFQNESIILQEENKVLEDSANYDLLTHALNRRLLETYFKKFRNETQYGSNFGIIMCDIDNFKKVNDTYGHDCGDKILKNTFKVLRETLRAEDIIFRWGGEEIVILVHGTEDNVKVVAERCRVEVSRSIVRHNDTLVKVTITIGGCMYNQNLSQEEMINIADERLYHGKHNGKNMVVM